MQYYTVEWGNKYTKYNDDIGKSLHHCKYVSILQMRERVRLNAYSYSSLHLFSPLSLSSCSFHSLHLIPSSYISWKIFLYASHWETSVNPFTNIRYDQHTTTTCYFGQYQKQKKTSQLHFIGEAS